MWCNKAGVGGDRQCKASLECSLQVGSMKLLWQVVKEVKPIVRCNYSGALWNLGGTCIADHVHKDSNYKPQVSVCESCPEQCFTSAVVVREND